MVFFSSQTVYPSVLLLFCVTRRPAFLRLIIHHLNTLIFLINNFMLMLTSPTMKAVASMRSALSMPIMAPTSSTICCSSWRTLKMKMFVTVAVWAWDWPRWARIVKICTNNWNSICTKTMPLPVKRPALQWEWLCWDRKMPRPSKIWFRTHKKLNTKKFYVV